MKHLLFLKFGLLVLENSNLVNSDLLCLLSIVLEVFEEHFGSYLDKNNKPGNKYLAYFIFFQIQLQYHPHEVRIYDLLNSS